VRISLLDRRFKYIPAAATDVAATWRRFGFDPRGNASRRAATGPDRVVRLAPKPERKAAGSEQA
jgi:hypothetical protein